MRAPIHSLLSNACFALGSVWGIAGACKLAFGIRITLPILPPLDLERVDGWWSLAVALVLFLAAGWFGRRAAPVGVTTALGAGGTRAALPEPPLQPLASPATPAAEPLERVRRPDTHRP